MKQIAVLMSTYNGETYLREQIDSILNQTNVHVQLIVRDDGSSDKTVSILETYEREGQLKLVKGKNIGVGNSFMQLLYHAPKADYYAFADQDDVWMENKLLMAVQKMEQEDGAVLYTSNQMLVDKNCRKIGMRYEKEPAMELFKVIDSNELSGCTMVMNDRLVSGLVQEKRRPSRQLLTLRIHDVWVMMASLCMGTVIYDPDAYIYYRQHGNNVIGAKKKGILKRLKLYLAVLTKRRQGNIRSRTAKELWDCFGDLAEGRNKKVLQMYQKLNTMRGKIDFCRSPYLRLLDGNVWIFRLKVLLNLV